MMARALLAEASESQSLRVGFAVVVGAGAAATGFPPLSLAADLLDVEHRPIAVLLTPSVVLTVVAVVAAWVFPRLGRALPLPVLLGAALLVLGGGCSVLVSDDPSASATLWVGGIVAPLVFLVALSVSSLPRNVVCAAFLGATVLLLIRADVVLFQSIGVPSPAELFEVKYTDVDFDFNYYTLANPNYTATFLIIPLSLAAIWAADPALPRVQRIALAVVAGVILANIVLVYVRLTIVIGAAVAGLAILAALPPGVWRRRLLAALGMGACALVLSSWSYFEDLGSGSDEASANVRVQSIVDGLEAFVDQPLTGTGLGRYGIARGFDPAHSSVVQALAETGIAGGVGTLLISAFAIALAIRRARTHGFRGLTAAGAVAAAVFCVQSAIAAGPPTWLASFATATWGFALGLGVAASSGRSRAEAAANELMTHAMAVAHRATRRLAGGVLLHLPDWAKETRNGLLAYGVAVSPVTLWFVLSVEGAGDLSTSGEESLRAVESHAVEGSQRGLHLLVPLLARALGSTDPGVGAGFLAAFCLLCLTIAAPLAAWALFHSRAAAIAAPFLLLPLGSLFSSPDIAWIGTWAMLLLLPVLLVLARSGAPGLLPVALVASVAGFASSIRPGAGFPVVLAAAVLVAWTSPTAERSLKGIAIVFLAYASFCGVLLGGVSIYRDATTESQRPSARAIPSLLVADLVAPVWRSAYFGLGWLDSSHGIDFKDDPAFSLGEDAASGEVDDDRYRDVVLGQWSDDTKGSVASALHKALVIAVDAIRALPVAVLSVIALGLTGFRSRMLWTGPARLVLVPAFAAALLYPLITAPVEPHVAAAMGVFATGWLLLSLEAVAAWGKAPSTAASRRYPAPQLAAAGLAATVAIVVLSDVDARLRTDERAFYDAGAAHTVSLSVATHGDVRSWSFAGDLHEDWRPVGGADLTSEEDRLRVNTGEGAGYQLLSPTVALSPGRYIVSADASVEAGGISLGVLDVRRDEFLSTANYSEHQSRGRPIRMGTSFSAYREIRAQIVLSNWHPLDDHSSWSVRRVRISSVMEGGDSGADGALSQLVESAAQRQQARWR